MWKIPTITNSSSNLPNIGLQLRNTFLSHNRSVRCFRRLFNRKHPYSLAQYSMSLHYKVTNRSACVAPRKCLRHRVKNSFGAGAADGVKHDVWVIILRRVAGASVMNVLCAANALPQFSWTLFFCECSMWVFGDLNIRCLAAYVVRFIFHLNCFVREWGLSQTESDPAALKFRIFCAKKTARIRSASLWGTVYVDVRNFYNSYSSRTPRCECKLPSVVAFGRLLECTCQIWLTRFGEPTQVLSNKF